MAKGAAGLVSPADTLQALMVDIPNCNAAIGPVANKRKHRQNNGDSLCLIYQYFTDHAVTERGKVSSEHNY